MRVMIWMRSGTVVEAKLPDGYTEDHIRAWLRPGDGIHVVTVTNEHNGRTEHIRAAAIERVTIEPPERKRPKP